MYGESIGAITFDFSDLERSMWILRSPRFRRPDKGTDLGHVLLLKTNSKSHMESPTAPSDLTLSDLVRSKSLRLWKRICCKRAKIGHMLLVNLNRKPYMWSQIVWFHLTLATFKGQCQVCLRSVWGNSVHFRILTALPESPRLHS